MLPDLVLIELNVAVQMAGDRHLKGKRIADAIRGFGSYRWVGIYDVDYAQGQVSNLAWSGSGPPAYPVFPLAKGLTGLAIAGRRTFNVGDVAQDPHYLTAFSSTRSEIIVPVFAEASGCVVGTIDVESENVNAFDPASQRFLEDCAEAIRSLWPDGEETS
jgi:putative methionine-R-sulfoxide reductase with GAF domain